MVIKVFQAKSALAPSGGGILYRSTRPERFLIFFKIYY